MANVRDVNPQSPSTFLTLQRNRIVKVTGIEWIDRDGQHVRQIFAICWYFVIVERVSLFAGTGEYLFRELLGQSVLPHDQHRVDRWIAVATQAFQNDRLAAFAIVVGEVDHFDEHFVVFFQR